MLCRVVLPLVSCVTLTLAACDPGPSVSAEPQTRPLIASRSSLDSSLCGLDRVSLAPDGTGSVLWTSSGASTSPVNRLVVVPSDCDDGDCSQSLTALDTFEAVTWSSSGELFAHTDTELLRISIRPDGLSVRDRTPLATPPNARMTRLGVSSSQSSKEEADAFRSAWASIEGRTRSPAAIRALSISDRGPSAWIERTEDGRLSLRTLGDSHAIALDDQLAAAVYFDVRLSAFQETAEAWIPGWSNRRQVSAYARPLLGSNGQTRGQIGPRSIHVDGQNTSVTAGIQRFLNDHTDFILEDATLNDDRITAVGRNLAGDVVLLRSAGDDLDVDYCRSDRAPAVDRRWAVASYGEADHAIGVHLHTGVEPSPKLVVFHHGGPATSLLDKGYEATIRSYVDLGYDVLAVDGTGSRDIGLGALARLRTEGPAAITRDAELVARFLRDLPHRYESIVVHGESFGAASAIVTAERLSADRLVLVVPWLKYREPESWLQPSTPANLTRQSRWEDGLFGPKQSTSALRFRTWLTTLATRSSFDANTLFLFASDDARSQREDIVPGTARVMVLDGNHSTVPRSPATWLAISSHIEARAARDPSSAPNRQTVGRP